MNLAPVYELRSRLRASMIAGTNLLSEDFRLKRVAEEINPLAAAAPVFAKIVEMVNALLAEGCEDRECVLMDTITLVDAVLCTQGTLAVGEEVTPIEIGGRGKVITNAPYSVVKGLVEALTTSGNGHYSFVVDTHEQRPELFEDYRVKSAMVKALGAGYTELAELVTGWLMQEGEEIVPMLQKDFDPKGKKEMVRRVQVIEAVAGGNANEFYVQMIPEAERDVKNELIYALRHNQENVELLLELMKKAKGNAKKMAYYALAEMEDERAEKAFWELYVKDAIDAMIYLRMTTTKWASKMVGENMVRLLDRCKEPGYGKGENVYTPMETELLRMMVEALVGKNGPEICRAYRVAAEVPGIYYGHEKMESVQEWQMHIPVRRQRCHRLNYQNLGAAMAYFLEVAIRMNPSQDLCELAMELYEKKSVPEKNSLYFRAAVVAQLLSGNDCTQWLRSRLFEKGLLKVKKRTDLEEQIGYAVTGLVYDEERICYCLQTYLKDEANDVVSMYTQPLVMNIGAAFADLMIECCCEKIDQHMIHWVNRKDEDCRSKMETYFYKRALTGPEDSLLTYWKGLKACGCERCDGLFVEYIKRVLSKNRLHGWILSNKLWELPGTAEAVDKEARVVFEMVQSGKLKVEYWNENDYLETLENVKSKRLEHF